MTLLFIGMCLSKMNIFVLFYDLLTQHQGIFSRWHFFFILASYLLYIFHSFFFFPFWQSSECYLPSCTLLLSNFKNYCCYTRLVLTRVWRKWGIWSVRTQPTTCLQIKSFSLNQTCYLSRDLPASASTDEGNLIQYYLASAVHPGADLKCLQVILPI